MNNEQQRNFLSVDDQIKGIDLLVERCERGDPPFKSADKAAKWLCANGLRCSEKHVRRMVALEYFTRKLHPKQVLGRWRGPGSNSKSNGKAADTEAFPEEVFTNLLGSIARQSAITARLDDEIEDLRDRRVSNLEKAVVLLRDRVGAMDKMLLNQTKEVN